MLTRLCLLDGFVILWRHNVDQKPAADSSDVECWSIVTILRGANAGIYDLAWSPSDDYILTGAIDNVAMVWEIDQG